MSEKTREFDANFGKDTGPTEKEISERVNLIASPLDNALETINTTGKTRERLVAAIRQVESVVQDLTSLALGAVVAPEIQKAYVGYNARVLLETAKQLSERIGQAKLIEDMLTQYGTGTKFDTQTLIKYLTEKRPE